MPRPPRQPLGESLVRIRGWVKFKLLNTPIQHACSTVRGIWSLTLVGLTMILTGPPLCPAAMPTLPNSHLPQQNHADRGGAKNKVNPTKACDQMLHPVVLRVFSFFSPWGILQGDTAHTRFAHASDLPGKMLGSPGKIPS